MLRLLITLFALMGLSQAVLAKNTLDDAAQGVEKAAEEVAQSYQQCEALYDEIRNSECAKSLMGFLGRLYLKVGMSFTERQVRFQNINTQEHAFILSSGLKPRPIFSISLSDTYFNNSQWGYSVGFNYFDDYAFEQQIERGSGDANKATVDLGTYSTMGVIAVSPSFFYGWGRGDDTPNRYGKAGLGLNLMYSNVRGTAYETELKSNAACYAAGSAYVAGTDLSSSSIINACGEVTRFRESSYGTGVKLFIDGVWNHWESELAVSMYNHRSDGEYRFVTQEVMLAFSRRFEF